MRDIRDYSLEELEEVFRNWGLPGYNARQVFAWIYQKRVGSFEAMSNLSRDLRIRLKEKFAFRPLALERLQESSDGTKKFLFRLGAKESIKRTENRQKVIAEGDFLEGGDFVESVLIPAQNRNTACLSSQAGCKYRCGFCASGLLGFKRGLETWEIMAQLSGIGVFSHIVFMGTGEPLDNYDNVLKAIRIINSKEGFNIGARRITISTCGIIPGIKRLSGEGLQIELSVSLHAADDKTRSLLMPVNKKYPLGELIAACREYAAATKRQVTFEYVLIKGVNCSKEAADNLSRLLRGWLAKVNLLVYNPVKEFSYQPPDRQEVLRFKRMLEEAGLTVTLRKGRGQDIDGACGQLRANFPSS